MICIKQGWSIHKSNAHNDQQLHMKKRILCGKQFNFKEVLCELLQNLNCPHKNHLILLYKIWFFGHLRLTFYFLKYIVKCKVLRFSYILRPPKSPSLILEKKSEKKASDFFNIKLRKKHSPLPLNFFTCGRGYP